MKNLKIIFILLYIFTLNSCQTVQDTMTGQKKKTTDEFLVKKKDPLILPPKFEELPIPNSKKKEDKSNSVQSIFNSGDKVISDPKATSNLEEMILKELGKKN